MSLCHWWGSAFVSAFFLARRTRPLLEPSLFILSNYAYANLMKKTKFRSNARQQSTRALRTFIKSSNEAFKSRFVFPSSREDFHSPSLLFSLLHRLNPIGQNQMMGSRCEFLSVPRLILA
jgi:hypothetical protein